MSLKMPSSSHAPTSGWHGPMRLPAITTLMPMGTSVHCLGASRLMGNPECLTYLHETFGKSTPLFSGPQKPKMGWLPYAQPILTSPGRETGGSSHLQHED